MYLRALNDGNLLGRNTSSSIARSKLRSEVISTMANRIVCALALLSFASLLSAQQLEVRIDDRLSSESSPAGSNFSGTLVRPVTINGRTCAANSPVYGTVSESKSSGRLSSPGVLGLQPTSISCNGRNLSLSAAPVRLEGRSHTKRNAILIGGGAGAGAILGGIMGGGKGAAIGSAVGAGAGTVSAAATGRHEAVVEPEALVAWNLNSASESSASNRNRSYYDGRGASDVRRNSYRDGDDQGEDNDSQGRRGSNQRSSVVFSERDRGYLRSCLPTYYRLPPGLAKKGKIPPGHAKKMQNYGDPLPYECTAQLSPLPRGWERVIVDDRVILRDTARRVIDYFIWRE